MRNGDFYYLQVSLHSLLELFLPHPVEQHPDDGRAFVVGDFVEDLVNVFRTLDFNLDRMRRVEGVEFSSGIESLREELGPDLPAGKEVVHAQELDPRRVALLQPKVSPPLYSYQVAEPLKPQF